MQCPQALSSALLLINLYHVKKFEFLPKNLGNAKNRTLANWMRSANLPLCYADPLPQVSLLLIVFIKCHRISLIGNTSSYLKVEVKQSCAWIVL